MPNHPLDRRQLLSLAGLAGLGGLAALSGCTSAGTPAGARSSTPAGTGAVPPTGSSGHPSAPPTASPTRTAPSPRAVGDGSDVSHGPVSVPKVALTFHGAGDPVLARAVLSELGRTSTRVTIFAVGSWLEAEPALTRLILDGGHDLGNHTYTHQAMRTLSAAKADTEVARCADVLTRLTGGKGPWFRPSGTPASTATIRAAARRGGYPQCVTYDLDSLDWTDPGAAAVERTVLAKVGNGSIISLHLGHAGTVRALPALIDGIAQRSLQPVTVTELLSA